MVLQETCRESPWIPQQKPEILAPVGSWETLETVVSAGAHAVYLGGKKLNMRMWRSEYNFTDDAIKNALAYTHAQGVHLYITLNNLYYEEDLGELQGFLAYLEKIQVDALIVQDLAVVNLVREMGLTLPLHASVQANVHNLGAMCQLKEMGFKRVIASKDLSLEEMFWLRRESGMELEIFVHGDLCVAHTGQCFTSSLIFGESSNQGRCLKPCRWAYQISHPADKRTYPSPGPYVLAMKDLCLYPYLPHLIQAGISSFKIEGRMRDGAYLAPIVRAYREAIDRYWDDPQSYRMCAETWATMEKQRVRDFTPGQAFARPSMEMFGYTGEREPAFLGRPVPIPRLSEVEVLAQKTPRSGKENAARSDLSGVQTAPTLAVRVGSLGALRAALAAGADTLYIGGEITAEEAHLWGRREVKEARKETEAAGAGLVLMTPKITKQREIGELSRWFKELKPFSLDGLMVGNWGTAWLARQLTDLPLYGDYALNLANSRALHQAATLGLTHATLSLEIPWDSLEKLLPQTPFSTEIMVHGILTGMVLDYNLPEIWRVPGSRIALKDEVGQPYPVGVDQFGRSHVYFPAQLCHLPILPELIKLGLTGFRLEIPTYTEKNAARIVQIYRKYLELALMDTRAYTITDEDWTFMQNLHPAGYTLGALT